MKLEKEIVTKQSDDKAPVTTTTYWISRGNDYSTMLGLSKEELTELNFLISTQLDESRTKLEKVEDMKRMVEPDLEAIKKQVDWDNRDNKNEDSNMEAEG